MQNVKDDPDFDIIAARLLRQDHLQARARRLRDRRASSTLLHRRTSPATSATRVEEGLLDPRLAELFDLDALAAAIDPARDDLLQVHRHRHDAQPLLHQRTATATPLEVPQYFWMRVAMGLSLNEANPTADGARASTTRCRSSSTSPRARRSSTPAPSYPQLSNCFVMQMEDDMEHIAKTVARRHVADQGHRRHRPLGHQAARRGLAHPVEQHDVDGADPVHAHDRLDPARGQPRRQEVRRAVLLHGELAPRLPRSSSTCARTPATRTGAPAPPTPRCGSPTSS